MHGKDPKKFIKDFGARLNNSFKTIGVTEFKLQATERSTKEGSVFKCWYTCL